MDSKMMAEKKSDSLWNKMVRGAAEVMGSNPAEAAPDFRSHPGYMDAQRRATAHYFSTGEQLPLKDYIDNPNLK